MPSQYHKVSVDLDSILAPRYAGWGQAADVSYQITGQDLAARYAVAAAGSAAGVIGYKKNGTDIGPTFAAFGSTTVTVASQPSAVSGSASVGLSGTVTSGAATCAAGPQGGPTKSYLWICTTGLIANSPTSSTSTFSATVSAHSTIYPVAYCQISDGITSVNTNAFTVTLTNTYIPVSVGLQPSNVSGTAAAGNPSGTVTSNATNCAGANGSGSYTYSWHLASGSGVSFSAPSTSSTDIFGVIGAGASNSGTMYCTISDGTSSINTNIVSWSLTNTTPAFSGRIDTFNAAGSFADTVPAGANVMIIEDWGPSGPGGAGYGGGSFSAGGGGGGAGAYSRSQYSVTAHNGQTIDITIPAANSLTSTVVSSGSMSITTMTSPSGGTGGVATGSGTSSTPGLAGSGASVATGGTLVNSTGANGAAGTGTTGGIGGTGTTGVNGTGGNGGRGGFAGSAGFTGSAGLVIIQFTP